MGRKTAKLLPSSQAILQRLGDRLRLARLRRRLTAKQVASRAGMAPMTLRNLERGGAGVTIGAYLAVMQVLGIDRELDQIAQADPLGRSLVDARLSTPARKRSAYEPANHKAELSGEKEGFPSEGTPLGASEETFFTGRKLADLIDPPASEHKRRR